MKIGVVLGTRPEIIKLSPVIRELDKRSIKYFILHTNQHFSPQMDEIFFKELKLKSPKYNLNINSMSHGKMIGNMMIKIEEVLVKEKPNWVLVQGDTNTTLTGAFMAQRLGIKVAHVEAGLRSYDRKMPEELNRIVTDHISDILFAPTETQKKILLSEGINSGKIRVVGNTIVDAVFGNLKLAEERDFAKKYRTMNFFLLTLHRPSNVDDERTLKSLIKTLETVANKYKTKILFPIHPRTENQIKRHNIIIDENFIQIIEPVGYLEMLIMEKYSKVILTDSGGLQEEACILKVPCITIRDNTERPETIDVRANILVGNKREKIIDGVNKMLRLKCNWKNPFGEGNASELIVTSLNIK